MNVLLVTASLPYPAASGGALRVLSLIKALRRLDHRVSLLAYENGDTDWRATPLAELCETVEIIPTPVRSRTRRLLSLLNFEADVARRLYSEGMAATLKNMLDTDKFDVVQAEGIEMAWVLPLAKRIQPPVRLVFDTFNAEYQLQRVIASIDFQDISRLHAAVYSWLQAWLVERYERAMCQLADMVIAVSPEDSKLLSELSGKKVPVVASAIEVEAYQDSGEVRDLGPAALVFTGKMDYRPNVDAALWLADEILPRVRLRVPGAVLVIVGQQPHPRLDRLRSIEGITVTGWVGSVVPYLRGAAVYVAPLRMGSGTRLKLLEAMASGCAIVATPTAASGLLPEAKAAMRLATDADGLAREIVTLLSGRASRQQLGALARAAVSAYYDWSAIVEPLRRVYREAGLG